MFTESTHSLELGLQTSQDRSTELRWIHFCGASSAANELRTRVVLGASDCQLLGDAVAIGQVSSWLLDQSHTIDILARHAEPSLVAHNILHSVFLNK